MERQIWDVIVIGAGAAGLSAALMLGRARRSVLVVDAGSPRNRFAAHMHGVLGNEGAAPGELLARGRAEVSSYGVILRDGVVERVDESASEISVMLTGGDTLRSRALVVASGLTDELPDITGLAERWGSSVLHCPYCHGWEFRDQRLGVLTTSPMGLHQAELVRQWSEDVTVFTAGAGTLSAEQERRLRSRGIRLISSPVVEVLGDGDQVTGARTAEDGIVALDAIYTAGTPRPHDGFLADLGLTREETPFGSFLAVDPMGKTSSDRIWAVGNVVSPPANVPMSIGAGAMAGGIVNMALITAEFDAAASALAAGIGEDRSAGRR